MKKRSYIIFMSVAFLLVLSSQAFSQGCVAIRGTGGAACMRPLQNGDSSGWLLNINNRYFKSYKHFVGTEEQYEREENGTQVINHTYNMDLFLSKNLNRRWSVGINIPIVNNTRSSLYEHGGNAAGPSARHNTHSFGLGDMRFAVYSWIVDPAKHTKWNVQAGLGLKLPTGDYRYQDYFIKNDSVKVLGPVDQSIQLGDGGTGITAEINAFYNFSSKLSAYANFYYLANPREQNGVSTARGGIPTAASISYGSNVMSVPDQYMIRGGVNFSVNNFTASAGVRKECIPVYDLIGGSNGFRRPGYIISIEPGLTYQIKKVTLYSFVPVALERNRTQSVPDKIRTEKTGVYAHGDAAFADYAVNIGMAIRF
jgi:hypothetical protein